MIVYLFTFIISVLITNKAHKNFEKGRKRKAVIISVVAILIPCIIAGLRDDSVGIDVLWYAVPEFNNAKIISSFLVYLSSSNVEFLYALLVYVTAKLFNDVGMLLFFSQLLVVLPVYICAYRYRKTFPMWQPMFVYYFLFYNLSMSIIRQSIACAILFFAYWYLQNKKYKRFIMYSMIAILFHTSAVFTILVLVLLTLVISNRFSFIFKILLLIVMCFVIVNITNIIEWLVYSPNVLSEKYLIRFLERTSEAGISLQETIIRATYTFIPLFLISNKIRSSDKMNMSYYFAIVGFILSLGGLISSYLTRTAYYFQYFYIITLPQTINSLKFQGNKKFISNYFFILWVMAYWMIIYVILNWHDTLPFIFRY